MPIPLHSRHTSRYEKDVYTTTQTSYLTTEMSTTQTPCFIIGMSVPLHRHHTSRERCLYHYRHHASWQGCLHHYTHIIPNKRDVYPTTQTSYLTVRERCLYHYTDNMPHDREVYTNTQTSNLTVRERCLYHYTDIIPYERGVYTTTQTSCLMIEMSIPLHRHHAHNGGVTDTLIHDRDVYTAT